MLRTEKRPVCGWNIMLVVEREELAGKQKEDSGKHIVKA